VGDLYSETAQKLFFWAPHLHSCTNGSETWRGGVDPLMQRVARVRQISQNHLD